MFRDKKIAVIMPAYNAAKTIIKTYKEVAAQENVDLIIIVDDASKDQTYSIAETLKNDRVKTIIHSHKKNLGYGGNQKTCYKLALQEEADIIIMIHPDYQYTPLLIPAMVGMIINKLYFCVLGSRMLGGSALKGNMPLWKYFLNRCLTRIENFILGAHLSEYHTGYRAFSSLIFNDISIKHNSNDFIFDNELLAQILWKGYSIGEISCPTNYFPEASVITLWDGIRYSFGCFRVALTYRLAKMKLIKSKLFP